MPNHLLSLAFVMAFLVISISMFAFEVQDLEFLIQHPEPSLLQKYIPHVNTMLQDALLPKSTLEKIAIFAQMSSSDAMLGKALYRLGTSYKELDAALSWLELKKEHSDIFSSLQKQILLSKYDLPEDILCLEKAMGQLSDSLFAIQIRSLESYNGYIEALAKQEIEQFATQNSDSLAMALIDAFEDDFPASNQLYYAYFYRLYHLIQNQDFKKAYELMTKPPKDEPFFYLVAVRFLLNELWLKQDEYSLNESLSIAQVYLDLVKTATANQEQQEFLFRQYDSSAWQHYLDSLQLKIYYLTLAQEFKQSEDKSELLDEYQRVLDFALSLKPENNDFGEEAALAFYLAKLYELMDEEPYIEQAAKAYLKCLIKGAPRKAFDEQAEEALKKIHASMQSELEFDPWCRELAAYDSFVFQDMTQELGMENKRYSRIAIGDYDNDGWLDLLFNGKHLFRNLQGQAFEEVTDELGLEQLSSSGGLWADFNKDGRLDFVALSHNADGNGDSLMKQQADGRFVRVNERAGDIDDALPSEAAAWVDIAKNGYPSLYVANYEKGSLGAGTPDMFWLNENGYFKDQSKELGFRQAEDMKGLCGRGVAPADFNDDGLTDILVTNYRLQRNFLFVNKGQHFEDQAFLAGVAGHYSKGYYGHSIGADWGDFDNDGDLDLFICNLAHPRFIDVSDISMLLRNDGIAEYEIDNEIIRYHKFTDITKEAGITYDELHSDPTWIDVDNDGFLDLYISSIYENERSYLYRNNGDGTFTDLTWLSNSRVYNAWGNACGDLNRDGLIDLVVASSSGIKILYNDTSTINQAMYLKPVWEKDSVILVENPWEHSSKANSPAFGTRIKTLLQDPDGKTYYLIRELNSAKGTCSQNAAELHFGIGESEVLSYQKAFTDE